LQDTRAWLRAATAQGDEELAQQLRYESYGAWVKAETLSALHDNMDTITQWLD
jgi:hypothetical protein